jgi:hypothetical protein
MNAVSKSNTIAGSRRGEDCSRCRDLLIRTIAYRMQELGLSKASQRKLAAPYAAESHTRITSYRHSSAVLNIRHQLADRQFRC